MYDEVILDRAVQIAAKNGWDGDIERSGYAPLVFNKDFARALWGNEMYSFSSIQSGEYYNIKDSYHKANLPRWMVMLQEMVISADPIKFLSDHMP